MPAPALTLEQVAALKPCSDDYKSLPFNGGALTAAEARAAGVTFAHLLWIAARASRLDADIERRLRHWKADCAAKALRFFEAEHPNDDRPREAIKAARLFADGKIDAAERFAAWKAAREASCAAQDGSRDAGVASWAARDAAWAATRPSAVPRAAWATEEQWQFDRLVQWLGEETPEPLPLPEIKETA